MTGTPHKSAAHTNEHAMRMNGKQPLTIFRLTRTKDYVGPAKSLSHLRHVSQQ